MLLGHWVFLVPFKRARLHPFFLNFIVCCCECTAPVCTVSLSHPFSSASPPDFDPFSHLESPAWSVLSFCSLNIRRFTLCFTLLMSPWRHVKLLHLKKWALLKENSSLPATVHTGCVHQCLTDMTFLELIAITISGSKNALMSNTGRYKQIVHSDPSNKVIQYL